MPNKNESHPVEVSQADSPQPSAAVRSYRAIAGILTERYGRHVTDKTVGRRCTAAERRLAAGLRNDPLIQRWLRRQRIEIGDERIDAMSG